MWKFQGEVACGPAEERGEVVEPARSHRELSRLQLARTSHPVPACRGTGQAQSLGAQVTLLEPCQPPHLSTWAQVQ